MISISDVKNAIRDVPDFPKKGILFKDLTTAFKQPEILRFITDALAEQYKNKGITKVVGIESRGFIIGSTLAYKLNAGFVLARKPGKLPSETYSKSYELEYGTDAIEIHKDAFSNADKVLVHDDLLATGGTALATIELVKQFGVANIETCFICELNFLNGRNRIIEHTSVFSLIRF